MFRAVPMVHLHVQVASRDGPAITRQIAAQGLLHLIDIAHGATPSGAAPASRDLLAKFRDLTRMIRHLAEVLDLPLPSLAGPLPPSDVADFTVEYQRIEQRLQPVRDEVESLWRQVKQDREEQARGAADLERASRLRAADVDPERLARLRFATVRLGHVDAAEMASLAGLLAPAPFAVLPLEGSSPRPLSAIIVPTSGLERLHAALRASTLEPVELPTDAVRDSRTQELTCVDSARSGSAALLGLPSAGAGRPERPALRQTHVSVSIDALRERAESAAETARVSGQRLLDATARVGELLRELASRTDVAVLLLQAQTMFATSGRFLLISGWIPEARAAELAAAMTRVSEGRAIVTIDKPEALPAAYASALTVPILYRNPLLLRPFQQLVQVYGMPSYGEVQPTAFFAASFLLMFGLMFGDVGHGLVLVLAGYCLFRYLPRFLDYGILLMEAGVASAVFGMLYGSLFGVESVLPVLWLRPIHDLPRFAGLAIGFGILLVSVGFVLNVVNSWRAGERAAALTSLRGVFGALMYWSALGLAARVLLPAWTLPDAAILGLLVVAVGLLVARPTIVRALGVDRGTKPREHAAPMWLMALEASVELVDSVFSYFANTISFVRVAAFAAVHAGIFVAMFALADTFAHFRFGGLLSVAVLVAGNIAMILLEGLTVTVQVLRLEYYEFFSRFFRGGGEPYRPLMLGPGKK